MPNALSTTTSPYLLQHEDNPVQWQPWGEAAFEQARREQKPVFLSIGYSTCHWCHVMAHESFENPEIAAVMNEYFVNVKVDREERPDVDRVYMSFVQATTGSGGWPMSVWLTPDAKPFFGGTYFPPTDRYGRPGFVTVLERIAELWATDRAGIVKQGDQVIEALRVSAATPPSADELNRQPLDLGFQAFAQAFDRAHGGFGGGPKFPRPSIFNFLLRVHATDGPQATEAREMSLFTLSQMAAGGMHDHLGGGFHRYSVDDRWHVPHFEKMLYDQAQLVGSYLDAWQITGDESFAATARDTLDYVTRDLSHADGGFLSAEDADSLIEADKPDHAEGAFYVWTGEQIDALLGAEADDFKTHYQVLPSGNAPESADPHGEFTGKNILTERPLEGSPTVPSTAADPALLARCRAVLFGNREHRPRPHLDDKVLTAWNGLTISAFARAGALLDDPAYLDRAHRAATFLHAELWDGSRLFRSWRDGHQGETHGFAEDYAYLIHGLLDLYEATFDHQWLDWAIDLQRVQDELFTDPAGGGYFASEDGDPLVPVRTKEDYDGAEPSASSVSVINLTRLGWMLHDNTYLDRARSVLTGFSTILTSQPSAVPQMLAALDFHLTPPRQIVIGGEPNALDTRALAAETRRPYRPNQVISLAQHIPATSDQKPIDGKAALYLCENFSCQLPRTADR